MGITKVLATGTVIPILLLRYCIKHSMPIPITFFFTHVTAIGVCLVIATSGCFISPEKTTFIMGKRRHNGRIRRIELMLFWPFHALLRTRLIFRRLRSKEPLYNEIIPRLYLGGWPMYAFGYPPGNPSILDLTSEYPSRHEHNRYLCIPIWDTQAPTVLQIKLAVRWAEIERNHRRPIYVHCAHGHGRSAVILCACLIHFGIVKDKKDALIVIKNLRPKVKLNKMQNFSLDGWIESNDREHNFPLDQWHEAINRK